MKNNKQDDCHCDSLEINQDLDSVETAKELALELANPLSGSMLVSTSDALGRVTAKPLYAPSEMPFFDNSAMDGYAVSIASLTGSGPWKVKIGETIAAGSSLGEFNEIYPGKNALRIFTGAPVPKGFDAVIPQEHCYEENGFLSFETKLKSGSNIRYAGSDIKRGTVLVTEGTRIAARHIGLLAVNGYGAINVRRLPKVAVFSTGDELVAPGEFVKPGQIYDGNKHLLIALFAELGIVAVDLGALPDDQNTTQDLLAKCCNKYDLIVSTGAVSVGERDYLKSAFVASGGFIGNWKVAVKPGKPVMLGKLGNAVFTGLPGNPFAAYVGFHLFVKPQLLRLCGIVEIVETQMNAIADFNWQRKPGRAEVFPVKRAGQITNGLDKLERLGNSVSATLFPLSSADGLAQISADCDSIKSGDIIKWQSFCE